jgi:hypothetical protein
MLHELQKEPSANKHNCLLVQEKVLVTLMRIEKRIRRHRGALKELRRYLSLGKEFVIEKAEAKRVKDAISWHSIRIKEYQHLLNTFRTLVDGLAFIYLDKWDIKPLAFKEQSGFISEKTGLDFELRILRLAFSSGHIALLNDLTNCLRYGDVTILAKGRKLFVEAKSGHGGNARVRRQKSELENIADYLTSGRSDKLHAIGGVDGEFIRLPIHGPEVNHRDQLNSIISTARRSPDQCCMVEVEPGLHYGATYVADPRMFARLIGKPPGSLIISSINELKYSGLGYYPFSLSIYDPEDWYDFCSGRLVLIVAVETKSLEDKLSPHGISVTITGEWDRFPIELTCNGLDTEPDKSLIGGHFFGRLFYEFLSLDWMLEELVYRRNHEIP